MFTELQQRSPDRSIALRPPPNGSPNLARNARRLFRDWPRLTLAEACEIRRQDGEVKDGKKVRTEEASAQ